jgi:hypothetical protein
MNGLRLHVEAWAPEYGGAFEGGELESPAGPVDLDVEVPAERWAPLDPVAPADVDHIDFVDGVRRMDARIWLGFPDGSTRMGVCASYAAGLSRCDGRAHVLAAEVRRALFSVAGAPAVRTRAGTYSPVAVADDAIDSLTLELQQKMGELEIQVAEMAAGLADATPAEDPAAGPGDVVAPPLEVSNQYSSVRTPARVGHARRRLVVIDGPLTGRQHVPGAIGYVKTHRVMYLPPAQAAMVAALRPGQRTPLFVTQTTWSRYSWYLRLPAGSGAGHPWIGVVRCEASSDLPLAEARAKADLSALRLPEFASASHKDPRAPQNLYPIAALERELRHRLGDAAFMHRALLAAANDFNRFGQPA